MKCMNCGEDNPADAVFCAGCGKRMETTFEFDKDDAPSPVNLSKEVESESNQGYASNDSMNANQGYAPNNSVNANQGYAPNNGMNPNYGYNGNNGYASGNGYAPNNGMNPGQGYYPNQNYGQMPNGMYQGYSVDPYKQYKRSVLPFKVTSGIMNLIAYFLLTIPVIISAALAVADSELDYEIRRISEVNSFSPYGYIALILMFPMFIFLILSFALPAKGGVGVSLTNAMFSLLIEVWGIILVSSADNKFEKYYGRYYSDSDTHMVCVGMNAFYIIAGIFTLLALVFAIIGLCKKKNV